MKRRDFIKYTTTSMAALWVGSKIPPWAPKPAQAQPEFQLDFTITDAIKEMYTHQGPFVVGGGDTVGPPFTLVALPGSRNNQALQYYWIYKQAGFPADSPGPLVFASEGDAITIRVVNNLDEAHNLTIPGIGFTTGPIAPNGGVFEGVINVPADAAGTYLYFDSLNAPVNRVMGLHGAFVVMPNPLTNAPFNAAQLAANPKLAALFNDLGAQPWWPGLAWDEVGVNGAPFHNTPGFRQFIWLVHQASPVLFAEVGDFTPGADFPAAQFVDRFLNDPLDPRAPATNDTPQFFTISGYTGHYSHDTPFLTPHLRVGEPCVVRCLNPGMWTHCMHLHANHFFMLRIRNEETGFSQFNSFPSLDPAVIGGIQDNHIWVDVFGAHPLDVWEYLIPYMRPPDVPNDLGIARTDLSNPLAVVPTPIRNFGKVVDAQGRERRGPTPAGVTTWPPVQEVNFNIPNIGKFATLPRIVNGRLRFVRSPIHVPLSPLCFPMHDHSEPTQTTQGGNYNTGLIAGMNFIGDRNADGRLPAPPADSGIVQGPGGVLTFPMAPLDFEPARPADVPEAGNPDNTAFPADLLAAGFLEQVFGADFNISPQPAGGPRQPFEESEEM